MTLRIVPITLKAAAKFVSLHHRHHDPAQGGKFAISVFDGDKLVGVAVAGRPCRMLDDGTVLEVTRLATDGTPNACSMLYTRVDRIGKLMGFVRTTTCILATEPGTSLRASGWIEHGPAGGPVESPFPAPGRSSPDRAQNTLLRSLT